VPASAKVNAKKDIVTTRTARRHSDRIWARLVALLGGDPSGMLIVLVSSVYANAERYGTSVVAVVRNLR
jgi:hypothetical protein